MVDPHTNGCLEPEVLAAYIDQGLSLTERARVEAHLASCPRCIAQVAGVARTVAELSASMPDVAVAAEATPLVTRRSLAGALAVAAAVIVVVAAPSLVRPWVGRDAGLVSLVERVGEQRSVLGRLTGGFPHTPLGVPSAGGQDGRAAGTDRVQLTAGKIRESVGERETPSELHALGVSQLLSGRYDDAAQSLLAASREQPANAQFLSDVAAVQLERARLGLRPDDLPRALAAADRARRLDPSLREAWFNSALAATALSLNADARSAWSEYLKRDSSSPWATEARQRLAELSSKRTAAEAWVGIEGRLRQPSLDAATADDAIRTQTTEARNFIENTLIVEWADAILKGKSGSPELERLRLMGQAMLRVSGDAVYADAVAAIDSAGTPASLARLAEAHRQYAAAAALFNQDAYAAALTEFSSSRKGFGHSSFDVLASLHESAIAFILGRADEAGRGLNATAETAQAKSYGYASGRANWFLGLLAVGQGNFGDGEARYEEALDAFNRMGDVEQAGAVHSVMASLYDYLGDGSSAWRHRGVAFEALSASRSPRFRAQVLFTSVPSIRLESPETALAVQDAALLAAQESGRDATIAESLAQRAALLASLNRLDEAAASIGDARQHLAALADSAFRDRVEVGLLATESDLARRNDPATAVSAAERAIALVEQRGDRLKIAQLQLRVAQANIVWGRTAQARAALDRGLRVFNEERAARTDQRPISALDESWELFDASVQLSLREKDYGRAFSLAEASRSRSASEAQQFGATSLDAVQAALGKDEAILAFNQFEDELAIWVIRNGSVNVTMRSMPRATSEKLIARQQHEIWESAATTAAGKSLYNEIVRPIVSQLAGASRWVFVPDATFSDLSFAALYNSANDHFLVEDVSIRVSPSAGAFAASVARTGRATVSEPLIFKAVESIDTDAIVNSYRASEVRAGVAATKARFFEDVADRRIVHVAARTAVNASYPLLSRLLVTDDPQKRHSGAILGVDIAQRTLPRTGLVVIDETGAATNRGDGTLSLARAFMAAGVPAVLGTLPGADETNARDLMIGFHREMAKGVSAEQALTTVQRKALQENGRRLGAWTALVLYGSDR
jgi:CHAT domain-containing protein